MEIQVSNSVIITEQGRTIPNLHLQNYNSDFENYCWSSIGSILQTKFISSDEIGEYFSLVEKLTGNGSFIHITKLHLDKISTESPSSLNILNKFPIDINESYVIVEDDFLIEKAFFEKSEYLLVFMMINFPQYGKEIVRIDTGCGSIITKKKLSIVYSDILNVEPFIFKTVDLVDVLKKWHQFLFKYESGLIPNLIPDHKSGELVIVQRDQVKGS
jgi:hypothetical protein